MVGGGGGALQTTPPPSLLYQSLHTTTHNRATTLMYMILPMYLLFIWRLYLMVLKRARSLLEALERVGPENLDFFGP
jgi:hypothetical protein